MSQELDPYLYQAEEMNTPIYHMCIEADFDQTVADGAEYFSPTFQFDQFIHATENPAFLLEAGNHFYKTSVGKWTCLKIDVAKLNPSAKVVYEAPAAVGAVEAVDYTAGEREKEQPLFPHIYGGICAASVMERFPIVRGEDGAFLQITGLC